jgi:hypothetical protein
MWPACSRALLENLRVFSLNFHFVSFPTLRPILRLLKLAEVILGHLRGNSLRVKFSINKVILVLGEPNFSL